MTTLYRFWDADGELLYVGITGRFRRRASDHARIQPWWERVASATFEHYADRESASRAELRAIRRERPQFNVMGQPVVLPERGHWPLWDGVNPDKADTPHTHLVTAEDIAGRLGQSRKAVQNWLRRELGFPTAVIDNGERVRLWSWPEVEAWARATGRLEG